MYDPFFTIVCPACGNEQTAVNLKFAENLPYTQTYRCDCGQTFTVELSLE